MTRLQRDWAQGRFRGLPAPAVSTAVPRHGRRHQHGARHVMGARERSRAVHRKEVAWCHHTEGHSPPPHPEEETTMLRMDRYPYSRFWAIWDQDLVAVVVYKKGPLSFCGGSRRAYPHPLEPLCQQRPPLPVRSGERQARGPARTPPGSGIIRARARSDARPSACRAVRRPGQSAHGYTPRQGGPPGPRQHQGEGKGRP